jgi:uncharacterized protein (DUF1501 family)
MLSRRAFLKSGSLAVVAFGVGGVPVFVNRAAAFTPGGGRRKVLVALFQRGAMDGLAAVQPLGNADLVRLRPNLVLPARELLDVGGGYGLHPALAPLHDLFREGRMAVVHGVGSPEATRSHFDAQDYMELGTPGRKSTPTGWLARASGLTGHEAAPTPFQRVALTSALPRSLAGADGALAIADLDTFTVGDRRAALAQGSLEALYRQATAAPDAVADTGREAYEAADLLARVRRETPRGTGYPPSPLGRSLEQIARLIRADVGLEVAFAEMGGWDTHVAQGSRQGTFARQAADLARSMRAFMDDLGPLQSDVVLMTMTEFGRTVRANGSGGTDHGRGSAMFVLGEGVRGGVYGQIEALSPDALEDGRDLPVTTDFRSLFAGVARGHLGVTATDRLFPGFTGEAMRIVGPS